MPDKTFWIIDRIKMACVILAMITVGAGQVIIGKRIIEGPSGSVAQTHASGERRGQE